MLETVSDPPIDKTIFDGELVELSENFVVEISSRIKFVGVQEIEVKGRAQLVLRIMYHNDPLPIEVTYHLPNVVKQMFERIMEKLAKYRVVDRSPADADRAKKEKEKNESSIIKQ